MTNRVKFTKMHGAGNDYIYVNTLKYTIEDPESFAKKWSCYRTGIGSDGLVLIGSSSVADFSMRIFNADGSEAMMCGNASRCIGKYVFEEGLTKKTVLTLETLSGIKELFLSVQDGIVTEVTVDMGNPKLEEALFLGAQALLIEISEHFRSLRYWGGLLFAGPESAAWEMAKKMQPRVAQGGEA